MSGVEEGLGFGGKFVSTVDCKGGACFCNACSSKGGLVQGFGRYITLKTLNPKSERCRVQGKSLSPEYFGTFHYV